MIETEFLLDTEKEGHCYVCGAPLDPWNFANRWTGYEGPGMLEIRDSLHWRKCGDCRRFVPEWIGALDYFWKELNS